MGTSLIDKAQRLRAVAASQRGLFCPTSSAIVVAFPALDNALGTLRRRLDPTARHGMPAHVTVLAPFGPPSRREPTTVARLEEGLGKFHTFPVVFERIGWFDERVMYLEPEPSAPFVELTLAAGAAFPAFPPYGGRFASVIPHLTVAEDAPRRRLRQAAATLARMLPLDATASSVWLMDRVGREGWRRAHSVELRSS